MRCTRRTARSPYSTILIGYDGDTAEVVIPDGVERVAASFVYDLGNPPETPITSLIFPDSVTEIDQYALLHCTKLRELTLGDGIRTIPADFLVNCRKLETVSLGRGLTYIAPQVFPDAGGGAARTRGVLCGALGDRT
ncbi:MAG: leucine-rich repeat protein [Acutalibacteraceae bacterium]